MFDSTDIYIYIYIYIMSLCFRVECVVCGVFTQMEYYHDTL